MYNIFILGNNQDMSIKANRKDMYIAKKRIELLQGEEVHLKVNQGRNRIVDYIGRVESMYDAIFTISDVESGKIYSYPYSDLITKNVRFYKI